MGDPGRQRSHPATFKLVRLGFGRLAVARATHQVDFYVVAQALAAAFEIGGAHLSQGDNPQTDHLGEVIQHRLLHQADVVIGLTGDGGHGQGRFSRPLHTVLDARDKVVHVRRLLGGERPGDPINLGPLQSRLPQQYEIGKSQRDRRQHDEQGDRGYAVKRIAAGDNALRIGSAYSYFALLFRGFVRFSLQHSGFWFRVLCCNDITQ